MCERYTEKAIQIIMLSQEESRQLGNNFRIGVHVFRESCQIAF
jgi:hypothetical protein